MTAAMAGNRELVDLAVVGAGPMGLVTALMAARAGVKVAVYERAEDFSSSRALMMSICRRFSMLAKLVSGS